MEEFEISVRPYKDADYKEVLKLVRDVWGLRDEALIRKTWDWFFRDNPFRPPEAPYCLVLEKNKELIGIHFYIYLNLKLQKETRISRWGAHLISHPKHRGEIARLFRGSLRLPYYPFIGSSSTGIADFLHKVTKWSGLIIGTIYYRKSVLEMKQFLRDKLKNKFISIFFGGIYNFIFANYLRIIKHPGLTVSRISIFDDKFDGLWQDASRDYSILVVRDKDYLNWRFINTPIEYRVYSSVKEGKLSGYIVLKVEEVDNVIKGKVAELFVKSDDTASAEALLLEAMRYFIQCKCVTAECLMHSSKKSYQSSLTKLGFFIKRAQKKFIGYAQDKVLSEEIGDFNSWFISAADPDVEL